MFLWAYGIFVGDWIDSKILDAFSLALHKWIYFWWFTELDLSLPLVLNQSSIFECNLFIPQNIFLEYKKRFLFHLSVDGFEKETLFWSEQEQQMRAIERPRLQS